MSMTPFRRLTVLFSSATSLMSTEHRKFFIHRVEDVNFSAFLFNRFTHYSLLHQSERYMCFSISITISHLSTTNSQPPPCRRNSKGNKQESGLRGYLITPERCGKSSMMSSITKWYTTTVTLTLSSAPITMTERVRNCNVRQVIENFFEKLIHIYIQTLYNKSLKVVIRDAAEEKKKQPHHSPPKVNVQLPDATAYVGAHAYEHVFGTDVFYCEACPETYITTAVNIRKAHKNRVSCQSLWRAKFDLQSACFLRAMKIHIHPGASLPVDSRTGRVLGGPPEGPGRHRGHLLRRI